MIAIPQSVTFDPWIKAWSEACIGTQCKGLQAYYLNSVMIVVPSTIISTALGAINGFAAGVRVDRDVFQGTVAQLQTMLVGKDPTAKPGDFNRDGFVNQADYNVWFSSNGKTVPIYSGADANGDARVTIADYNIWLANVPEPGAFVLTLIGMCALALRSLPRPAS